MGGASVDMERPTWFANKGYKVLSTSNSGNYKGESSIIRNNFPSTGAHNLFFYLLFKNITPEEVLIGNGNIITAEIRCSGYPESDSVTKNATGSDSYNGKGLMIWGSHGITDSYDQNSTYALRAACVAP
jgi:hypothetical protein